MSTFRRRSSELLLEARKYRAPSQTTSEAIFNFLSAIDTPRSLTVWLLYKTGEHDQLTALDIDPDWYDGNPHTFRNDFVATSFLSKARFLKTSFKKDVVAYEKFLKFEELCRSTNRRFLDPHLDPLNNGSNVWLLNAIKRKIEIVLGDFSADEFVDDANWGPGVSTLVKGEHVSAINKFHEERGITRDLYALVGQTFDEPRGLFRVAYPAWHDSLSRLHGENYFVMQSGNAIVTVPKNSKTDRVIAIEPGINLWFQKAIGSMIRRRLRRFGIDLNTQETNRRLAYLASRHSLSGDESKQIATVDFSSASDSISREVVRELLPARWYQLLDSCRSKVGTLPNGQVVKWEKFSSMGNGFTFELESLIFFCAAWVCKDFVGAEGEISVFGDDVILPMSAFSLFSEFSNFLGFKVNLSKSCSTGYYRESCGSYFFSGLDCKPLFLKEKLSEIETVYKLANGIRLLAHRYGFNRSCDLRFLDCWTALVLRIPEPLRFRVPRTAGDAGLVSNFDEATPRRARYGIEGYLYRQLARVGVRQHSEVDAVLLARLWNGSPGLDTPRLRPKGSIRWYFSEYGTTEYKDLIEKGYGNAYTLRGRTTRIVTDSLVVQWYNLGEWS
jgi:hypothetical protein